MRYEKRGTRVDSTRVHVPFSNVPHWLTNAGVDLGAAVHTKIRMIIGDMSEGLL